MVSAMGSKARKMLAKAQTDGLQDVREALDALEEGIYVICRVSSPI